MVANHSFSQFPEFADSYGILTTVAGKGEKDNSGEIGWKDEFENGNAIDAELTRPHFAMADSIGNIFIADKDAHGIRKVTVDGKIHTVAGTNKLGFNGDGLGIECQLSSPNGLWVKPDGTVYILDLGNDKIRRLDVAGNLETVVDDDEGITLGRGIWVTESEDTIFYASGSKIKIWTKSAGISVYSSGYRALGNIVMDKNGFLVVTDRSANLVYRINKDGSEKEIIAGNGTGTGGGNGYLATETGLDGVRGVWFLDDNSYFVATHEGSQIWYIDINGKIHLFLNGKDGDRYHSGDGENYRTPGYKISEPRSVTVDYSGNVLITENDNGYIRKIENKFIYYYTGIYSGKKTVHNSSISPNPANSVAELQFSLSAADIVTIELFNSFGKKLYTAYKEECNQGLHNITLDTSELPEGLFYYKISSLREEVTKPFIVYHF